MITIYTCSRPTNATSSPSHQEFSHALEHLFIVFFDHAFRISVLVISERDEELANESIGEKKHSTWSLTTSGRQLAKLDAVKSSVLVNAVLSNMSVLYCE